MFEQNGAFRECCFRCVYFVNFACLFAQGKYEEALPMYKEALAISKAALGDDHAHVAIRLNNLALCLDNMVCFLYSLLSQLPSRVFESHGAFREKKCCVLL